MAQLLHSIIITSTFLCITICHIILNCSVACAGEPAVADNHPDAVILGEKLFYDMEFWFFKKAATGSLVFEKDPKGYKAVFTAETCGFIKLFAGHRVETMESIMEYDQTKGKLRPLMFQELFSHGGREIKKYILFDYERRIFTYCVERNKQRIFFTKKKLPSKEFDDLLTFFYNLRLGYYGAVKEGNKYNICVLVKERPSYISIDCTPLDSKHKDDGSLYAVMTMDKDLTQARSKKVTSWLSQDSVPLSGIVENAYFFGDLSVTLRERAHPPERTEKQEVSPPQSKE